MLFARRSRRFVLPAFSGLLSAASVAMAQAVDRTSAAGDRDVLKLDRVTVEDFRADAYTTAVAPSSTKSPIPLLEVPQSLSVVSGSLLRDQAARKLEDALANVAGVSAGGYFGEWDYYRIRGFDVSYTGTYLDGLLNDSAPAEETWGLERIEVVKGPASSLYGQGSPGGFVNLVSKRPGPTAFGELQLTVGSFDEYETAFDVNTPLNRDASVSARLNVLLRTAGSFVDFVDSKRVFIAPALTWAIGPDTTLTLLTSYRADTMDLAFALPASGTVLPNPNGKIRHSLYIGNPRLGNDEWERSVRLGYEFRHRFNSRLSLRQNFRRYQLDFTSDDLSYPDYPESMEDDRTLRLSGYRGLGQFDGWRVDTALDGEFATGAVRHTFTAGVDFHRSDIFYDSKYADPVYFDVYAPDYAALPDYHYSSGDLYTESGDDLGFYVQDRLQLPAGFALTVGARYDHSTFDATPDDLAASSVTPRVGLTYDLRPGTVLYGNYSTSFYPQWYSVDANAVPLDPETGRNAEIGLKTALPDGRITTSIALFQLTRRNVATPDLSTPDPSDSILSGEQRSRGLELETSLRVTPGWQVTAAYTYIDAEVTADNDLPVGAPLLGVARHAYDFWTKYTVQRGAFQGFGLGLGVHGYSKQSGDLYHTFDLPAYTLTDIALYYTRGRFSAQLNIDNLFDREFYAGSYDYLYVLPGEPRKARFSVGWQF